MATFMQKLLATFLVVYSNLVFALADLPLKLPDIQKGASAIGNDHIGLGKAPKSSHAPKAYSGGEEESSSDALIILIVLAIVFSLVGVIFYKRLRGE